MKTLILKYNAVYHYNNITTRGKYILLCLALQPQVWPEWGQNKESLAELWTGLLKFYTEEFLYNEHVISIRQREPLMRFEKPWNGKRIAIEGMWVQYLQELWLQIERKLTKACL